MGLLKRWANQFAREPLDVFKNKEAERAKGLIDAAIQSKFGTDSTIGMLTHPGGAFTQSVFNESMRAIGRGQREATGSFKSLLDKSTPSADTLKRGGGSLLKGVQTTG